MVDSPDTLRRRKLKEQMDELVERRKVMIDEERAKVAARQKEASDDLSAQRIRVAEEQKAERARGADRETWRQDKHATSRADAATALAKKKAEEEEHVHTEERTARKEEQDKKLREFHEANVEKKVKQKLAKAKDEEGKLVVAADQRSAKEEQEVRALLERDKTHLHNEQKKKMNKADAEAQQMRSKLTAEVEAAKRSTEKSGASEVARNRAKGMLIIDEQLEKKLLDIQIETERLEKELERRAQEKLSRIKSDGGKKKTEAHKKLEQTEDWFNRDTEVIKDPMDV